DSARPPVRRRRERSKNTRQPTLGGNGPGDHIFASTSTELQVRRRDRLLKPSSSWASRGSGSSWDPLPLSMSTMAPLLLQTPCARSLLKSWDECSSELADQQTGRRKHKPIGHSPQRRCSTGG